LPEPLGPIRTKISPGWTSKVMSLRTGTPEKLFDTWSTVTPTALASAPVNGLRVLLQGESMGMRVLYMRIFVTK